MVVLMKGTFERLLPGKSNVYDCPALYWVDGNVKLRDWPVSVETSKETVAVMVDDDADTITTIFVPVSVVS